MMNTSMNAGGGGGGSGGASRRTYYCPITHLPLTRDEYVREKMKTDSGYVKYGHAKCSCVNCKGLKLVSVQCDKCGEFHSAASKHSCPKDAQAITPASDQTGSSNMSFSSDLPVEQWGKTQVLAKLNNWMNPSNEPNERVTLFINALLEQGYDHGTALIDLTREDLDELFPNQYLGYKKTILNGIESLKTTNCSSTTIPESSGYYQNVESVRGINSQHITGPVSYTAGNYLLSLGAFMTGLSQMTGESGICSIGGRSVRYQVSGRLHSFKWVYDAKVMDLATQVQGNSRHYKSRNGALGHALNDLGNQLKARGILSD